MYDIWYDILYYNVIVAYNITVIIILHYYIIWYSGLPKDNQKKRKDKHRKHKKNERS